MSKTLMVMAGGTGGHVYPAMAVADHLQAKGWKIIWLCTEGGMENKLIESKPYEKAMITMKGVRGNGLMGWVKLPYKLSVACKQAYQAIKQHQPNVILGMGGFAAFPGGLMAKMLGVSMVVHEQNSVAGLTNKTLSKIANITLAAFPTAFGDKAQLVGNPVRTDIVNIAPPAKRFEDRNAPLRILVAGGSLGAKVLNEILPEAFSMLDEKQKLKVVHQAGEQHIETLKETYSNNNVNAMAVAFIKEMAQVYEWADIVICRSGALTVAELSAAGVASVLIPFPFAVDDHQTSNAKYLSDVGAAILVPQTELTVAGMVSILEGLNKAQCMQMAIKAHALGKPNATEAVANICEEYAR